MNNLLIQDVFEPYWAGRPGYTAPDAAKRRKPAEKKESDSAEGKDEVSESRPKTAGQDH